MHNERCGLDTYFVGTQCTGMQEKKKKKRGGGKKKEKAPHSYSASPLTSHLFFSFFLFLLFLFTLPCEMRSFFFFFPKLAPSW